MMQSKERLKDSAIIVVVISVLVYLYEELEDETYRYRYLNDFMLLVGLVVAIVCAGLNVKHTWAQGRLSQGSEKYATTAVSAYVLFVCIWTMASLGNPIIFKFDVKKEAKSESVMAKIKGAFKSKK